MTRPLTARQERPRNLRVLIVDDEPEVRDQLAELIRLWGHLPVVAAGSGAALLADAIARARRDRCQIAIVDMNLLDPRDQSDKSGLELVARLKPAVSIIYTGYGDRRDAVAAIRRFDAFTLIGKQDSPHDLQEAIEDAARSVAAGGSGPLIDWGPLAGDDHGPLASQMLAQLLNRGEGPAADASIPPDQIGEVVGRLFREKGRVFLQPLTDDEPTVSPSADTTLRRSSRLFEAIVENEGRRRVVKLARKDKITNEVANYTEFVSNRMPATYFTHLEGWACHWDVGGVVYNQLGADDDLTLFRRFYHQQRDPRRLLRPLHAFFDHKSWGFWYRHEARQAQASLFTIYDELFKRGLSRHFDEWREHDPQLDLPGLGRALPNPLRWIVQQYHRSGQLRQSQLAVTHGDLHSDNLFVGDSAAFPIDFERTGYGPILRDYVELTQDLSTRVAWQPGGADTRPDLRLIYDLAVAWCAPRSPTEPLPRTSRIAADRAASKLHEVVQGLLQLAHKQTHYVDQRELLWGMLLNHLFVASRLSPGGDRWMRTSLFAAVICGRLDSWGAEAWPPPSWPELEWI